VAAAGASSRELVPFSRQQHLTGGWIVRHLSSVTLVIVGVIHLLPLSGVLYAAFRAALRRAAYIGGLVSVVSLLWLAGVTSGYNASLGRAIVADWLALGLLIAGIAGEGFIRSRARASAVIG
ncbi:MAG TPA: hypothetical protein VF266_24975, partial [Thermoanaerobaculia bacterium]